MVILAIEFRLVIGDLIDIEVSPLLQRERMADGTEQVLRGKRLELSIPTPTVNRSHDLYPSPIFFFAFSNIPRQVVQSGSNRLF